VAGRTAVVGTNVCFPAVNPATAGLAAWWINQVLRDALGFAGAAVSDYLTIAAAGAAGPTTERVRRAREAGCDLVLICNAPDEVRTVLDDLEDYVNPVGQLRLTRLHGRGRPPGWDELHASAEWARATRTLEALCARPALELRG